MKDAYRDLLIGFDRAYQHKNLSSLKILEQVVLSFTAPTKVDKNIVLSADYLCWEARRAAATNL